MPTVHTHYVTWGRQGRRRHAGSASVDIVPELDTNVANPGLYQAWAPPSLAANGTTTANFAFWSVTGSPDGPSVSTNPSLSVNVGSSDVVATAWYIDVSGGVGGHGGPAVYIDAFDVGLGTFVDDDFVDVITDPSLTAEANDNGFVPTDESAENIRAYASIHAVPLDSWMVIVQPATVQGANLLEAAAQTSPIAFAFYKAPVQSQPRIPSRVYELGTWVSYGVMVDGGGPTGRGPVPPWTPFIREFAVGLAMAEGSLLVRKELRGAALTIAADQVKRAAADIAQKMSQHGQ